MKNSYELLQRAGIIPKLRLGIKKGGGGVIPTGPHRVRLIEDKIIKDLDKETGKEIEFMRYILEENGDRKYYQSKVKDKKGELSYFVQRMAEVPENGEVILEMRRSGIKNYIEVTPITHSANVEVEESEVDEEENNQDIP